MCAMHTVGHLLAARNHLLQMEPVRFVVLILDEVSATLELWQLGSISRDIGLCRPLLVGGRDRRHVVTSKSRHGAAPQ